MRLPTGRFANAAWALYATRLSMWRPLLSPPQPRSVLHLPGHCPWAQPWLTLLRHVFGPWPDTKDRQWKRGADQRALACPPDHTMINSGRSHDPPGQSTDRGRERGVLDVITKWGRPSGHL